MDVMPPRAAVRFDGLLHVYGEMARQMGAAFANGGAAVGYDADTLYARDGIARRIVNRPAEDAMARGFTVEVSEADGDGEDILNELDRLKASQALIDAVRWCRKDGASAILMLTDDAADLGTPLNLNLLNQVTGLIPYQVANLHPGSDTYDDPRQPNYGMPITYQITPRRGAPFVAHESRLLLLSGEPLPYNAQGAHPIAWLGVSELEACWEDLQRYRSALSLARAMMVRKQQAVHKMSGLAQALAGGMEDVVRKRLDLADAVRNIFNAVGIDGEDDFVITDTSLSGVPEVIRVYMVALATSAAMPLVVLFGEDIKGLGSAGTGELNIYHQLLTQIQERQIRPALERLITVLWMQRSLNRKQPTKWRVAFNPLFSPSEGERADVSFKQAQAIKTRIEAMAEAQAFILPEEARNYLARTEPDLRIEPDSAPPPMPDNTGSGDNGGAGGNTA